jgi:L-amino acid N-acyltransferase YncA
MKRITDTNSILNFYKDNYKDQEILIPTRQYIEKNIYYGIYQDETLLSLISVTDHYGKIAELNQLVVHRYYRRKGVGTKTYLELEKELQSQGYRKILTWIITTNYASLFGALKMGFLVEGLTRDNLENTDVYCCGKLIVEKR